MILYHGTSKENAKRILRYGLRKGSYLSPDIKGASIFSKNNGVILEVNIISDMQVRKLDKNMPRPKWISLINIKDLKELGK